VSEVIIHLWEKKLSAATCIQNAPPYNITMV
jgi:hypothetical protein